MGWLLPAVAIVLAGGLVACTGGGEPSDPSTSVTVSRSSATPSPIPSSSPPRTHPLTTGAGVLRGEKPPLMNPLAREHNRLGAYEFAIYYIRAVDWSYATSDPYLLEKVSAKSCQTCEKIITGLSNLIQSGGHVAGDRLNIQSSQILDSYKGKIESDYVVMIKTTQQPGAIVDSTGRTSNQHSLTHVTSYIYLSWLGVRWQVLGDFGS